jgi:hypothetical protein
MSGLYVYILWFWWLPVSNLHDFHTSIAQMNYNASSNSFEVSLRVFTDDLEAALSRENSRKIVLDDTPEVDAAIAAYVQKHFAMLEPNNQKAAMNYIGKEAAVDATWIYVEIKPNGTPKGMRLQNSVLMELFDDQVNIVNFVYGSTKRTFLFKPKQTVHDVGG